MQINSILLSDAHGVPRVFAWKLAAWACMQIEVLGAVSEMDECNMLSIVERSDGSPVAFRMPSVAWQAALGTCRLPT